MAIEVKATVCNEKPALEFRGTLPRNARSAAGKLIDDSGKDHAFALKVTGASVTGSVERRRMLKSQPLTLTVVFDDESSESFYLFDRDDLSDDWVELTAQGNQGQLGDLGCDPRKGCAPE